MDKGDRLVAAKLAPERGDERGPPPQIRLVPEHGDALLALRQPAERQMKAHGRRTRVEENKTDSLYYNRLWIDRSQCIRCGRCESVCPVNAITIQKVSLRG